jgi:PAS domain S-box-containing protein
LDLRFVEVTIPFVRLHRNDCTYVPVLLTVKEWMDNIKTMNSVLPVSRRSSGSGVVPAALRRLWPFTSSVVTTEEALHRSEDINRAILGSLYDQVAVVDSQGAIVAVNDAWHTVKTASRTMQAVAVGVNYLEICRRAITEYGDIARNALEGIQSILSGASERFEMEYSCDLPDEKRWFLMNVMRLYAPGGGAIVTHRNISDRKRAEEALRNSEARFREVVEAQTQLVCRYLPDTTITFVNNTYCRNFNRTREQLIGTRFLELIPESSRKMTLRYVESLSENPKGRTFVHEVKLPNGTIGWQEWRDIPIFDLDGRVKEIQGIGADITDRKHFELTLELKEAALRASYAKIMDLAGRLIVAQESERTRIARELHDDFNQQIAAISISLSGMKRQLPESAVELQENVGRLQGDVIRLSDEIRHLSHDLHPGVLQHAGLVPALRSRIAEFYSQYRIETTIDAEGDMQHLQSDLSLCLYRVTQEALHNIARHSGAGHALIKLKQIDGNLELSISDDGRGFEPEQVKASGQGLGLISMEERIHFAGGTLRIEAIPDQGTTLRVRVPLGRSS